MDDLNNSLSLVMSSIIDKQTFETESYQCKINIVI